ncbi:MAG: hypothetical protein Q9O74_03555 [Planctomycetota bacterium]|nr:hypothetical protein [Planctomycetota bacterium]
MPRQATLLVLFLLIATHRLAPVALAQNDPATPDPDPVATIWVWLADAPVNDRGFLNALPSPAAAAFDLELQDLRITKNTRKPQSLARAALAARLGAQLASLPAEERPALIEFLAEHEELAAEVAFLLGPRDDIPAAYRVLARLIEAHGDRVAELAPLAAAICAVHDQPTPRRVNENSVPLIDPVELFGYYATNQRQMRSDLTKAPATVLVHLADAAGTIEEYDWARKRYLRDKDLGNRYKEIVYDSRAGAEDGYIKKVTEAGGYSLQTIRQFGGICADQAYFALSVGKACGIPACYVRGKGGGVSHAWIGFVEQKGRKSSQWNFDAGRYTSFEDVQGTVRDPQTGEHVPDAFLAITAMSTFASRDQRHQSVALADAAIRLGYLAYINNTGGGINPEVAAQQLDLLESALRTDVGNLSAWLFARRLVATPTSSLAQKEHWTAAVDQLAAQTNPDFAFEMIAPIFAAETDLNIRFNLWDWAATRFASRPDLAARARLAQTRLMIEQGREPDAIIAAHAVFTQHPKAGPYAVEALALAEHLLTEAGRQDEAVEMYKQAFATLKPPRRLATNFLEQTSWFQVGTRYAELLEAAGESRKAATIQKRLGR